MIRPTVLPCGDAPAGRQTASGNGTDVNARVRDWMRRYGSQGDCSNGPRYRDAGQNRTR